MKRYIAALLVTVLLVPLLAVPVWAVNFHPDTYIEQYYLPVGYVTTSGNPTLMNGTDATYLVWYSTQYDMYFELWTTSANPFIIMDDGFNFYLSSTSPFASSTAIWALYCDGVSTSGQHDSLSDGTWNRKPVSHVTMSANAWNYELKWQQYGNHFVLGGQYLYGYPVALFYNGAQSYVSYANGAYYAGHIRSKYDFRIVNYEKLPVTDMTKDHNMPYSVLNRYLTSLGYEPVYYGGDGQLSNEIAGVGNTINSWSGSAGDYNSIASGSVSSIQSSVSAFQPFFLGVWNILPSWFAVLLTVSIVIVIGRKILGR